MCWTAWSHLQLLSAPASIRLAEWTMLSALFLSASGWSSCEARQWGSQCVSKDLAAQQRGGSFVVTNLWHLRLGTPPVPQRSPSCPSSFLIAGEAGVGWGGGGRVGTWCFMWSFHRMCAWGIWNLSEWSKGREIGTDWKLRHKVLR